MKPRTLVEKEVDKLIPWLLPISDEQVNKLTDDAFGGQFFTYNYKGRMTCMHCGHQFSVSDGKVCPCCGHTMRPYHRETKKYTQSLAAYVCLCQEVNEDYQVFRYFQFRTSCKAGRKPQTNAFECWQKWLRKDSKVVYAARNRGLSWCYDNWLHSSDITIKRPYKNFCGNDYFEWTVRTTLIDGVMPIIRRNGFDGNENNFAGIDGWDLMVALLTNPFIETLYKQGRFGLLRQLIGRHISDSLIPCLKIALRHGYEVNEENFTMWTDYVEMLGKLGLDTHSPHYICPENLKEAHDQRMREIALQKIKKEEEDAYRASHKKFFGLEITDGVIHVKPLESVVEFYEEGEKMHHCVYRNKYYELPNSLVMSARINGQRIETVEVNLLTYTINQCYGKHDKLTPFHDAILQLVESHMDEIQRVNRGHLKAAV